MKKTNSISLLSRVFNSVAMFASLCHTVVKLVIKPAILLITLLSSQLLFAATCQYDLVDEWNTGFRADISIINESSTPVNNWEVSWAWTDGSSLQDGWNAVYDCNANVCTATGPSYALNVDANQTFTFGFNGEKGTIDVPAQASITVNGDACDSATSTPTPTTPTTPTTPPTPPTPNPTSAAMLAPIIALLLETTPTEESLGLWTLDGAQSNIQYVSTKNDHTAEVNRFTQGTDGTNSLNGSIDNSGNAILSIDLNDLETGIDTRNERMLNFVFETELLPTAYITVALDPDSLSSMSVGESETQSITGELSLHGVSQNIVADVLIAKTSATSLVVSTVKPILIDSKGFDFASGIEVLRTLANLSSIGEVVPVYFRLHYEKNADANASPLAMASKPAGPSDLSGQYNVTSANAVLNWQDNSTNESGFIVRRKTDVGLWSTVANVLRGVSRYSDGLTNVGEFDYKVIAVNGSVPSTPSNIARVTATDPNDPVDPTDPIAVGKGLYDQQCATCHGPSGGGVGSFPALNTPRDLPTMANYIAQFMPLGNPGACDQQCADDIVRYIETLWVDVDVTSCDASISPISYGARQLKILTRSEYQRSVEDLLGVDFNAADGLSEDDKIGLFANNTHASIVSSSYSNYLIVAEEIAQWSSAQNFAPALSCNTLNQECANRFISDLAPRIFRRPLESDEVDTYSAMANGSLTGGDIKAGIALAMEAMLSAPPFLYRHELGEPNPNNPDIDGDAFELTSYEMATFLSYTFTGSTPDQTLLTAANDDLLRTDSEILDQAVRLSEEAQAKEVMGDFVGSWLGTNDLDIAAKDENVWPGFSALVPHMKNEIRESFANVMLDENESFNSFYNADFTYLNQPLAQHYGIPGVTGDEMRRVATADRGGILANGAFMARWGEAVESAPIIRSVRVRRRMLCQDELPDPPAGTFAAREAKLAELSDFLRDPSTTNRDKYHRLTEDQACTSCHLQYINPLGFGMEDFDTVGNVRSNDLIGNIIDAVGELFAPNDYSNVDEVEAFSGTQGLAQLLSSLPTAQSCISKQMFRYVIGVGHKDIDAANPEGPEMSDQEKAGYSCEVDNLTQSMMDSSPRAMLESFSTLEAVRYRKAWSRD